MMNRLAAGGLVVGALALGLALAQDSAPETGAAQSGATFRLGSSYVVDGRNVPATIVGVDRRCGLGRNVSPQLSWVGVPEGTKSLALTVFDPDARQGQGFWHWLVYNIPADATGLDAGAGGGAVPVNAVGTVATSTDGSSLAPPADTTATLPEGAVNGANGAGKTGYIGPCPPAGDAAHHYVFTLYALDVESLNLPEGATGAAVPAAAEGHTLGTATLTGLYAVPKPEGSGQ